MEKINIGSGLKHLLPIFFCLNKNKNTVDFEKRKPNNCDENESKNENKNDRKQKTPRKAVKTHTYKYITLQVTTNYYKQLHNDLLQITTLYYI